jgi:hypothetical protein
MSGNIDSSMNSSEPPPVPIDNVNNPTVDALVNLLEDEDAHISTLAMEQLLRHQDAETLVAELQESASPLLRTRIHQLGNILNLRRARLDFISRVEGGNLSLGQGLEQINYLYNPRMNVGAVETMFNELLAKMPTDVNTNRLTAFMRNENFTYTGEDILGADLYLIEDVLAQRIGAPVILSLIARQLGRQLGWNASIVLFKGKHCLLDPRGHLIEPAENWRITRLPRHDNLHPCGNKEIWLTVLCQLFLSAMLEGRLLAIHRVGSIIARLCDGDCRDLPFPLGS